MKPKKCFPRTVFKKGTQFKIAKEVKSRNLKDKFVQVSKL